MHHCTVVAGTMYARWHRSTTFWLQNKHRAISTIHENYINGPFFVKSPSPMLLLSLLLWVAAVSAILVKPTPASEDSFYHPPANISDYKNGDIIGWRPAPAKIRSIYFPVNVKNAWQLQVRSENSHGEAQQIVTTILEPYDADPKKLLSYQAAQDSASINCSPSYSMLFNAPMDTIVLQAEMVLMQTALAKGWYLVVPDYEGNQGAFTAGIQSGQATLDSLRAALNSEDLSGIDPQAKAAFWGYSGGTIASGWAASLQPKYAPELKENLIGCAVGGWVTNITLTAEATDGTLFAGLIPNALNGLLSEYPSLNDALKEEIKSSKIQAFLMAKDYCLPESALKYLFTKFFSGIGKWAKRGWDVFDNPQVLEVITNNTAALSPDGPIPEIPMFVFHGKADEVVPFSGAQRGYDNYCKWGINSFEFAISKTTGHILEVIEGSGAALVWLEKMFNGEKPVEGCQATERTTNILYPGADVQYHQIVATLFSSFFGGKIGETTKDIDDSTLVSWMLQQFFGWVFTFLGPIPLKRDLSVNSTVTELTGLNDVLALWRSHDIDVLAKTVIPE